MGRGVVVDGIALAMMPHLPAPPVNGEPGVRLRTLNHVASVTCARSSRALPPEPAGWLAGVVAGAGRRHFGRIAW